MFFTFVDKNEEMCLSCDMEIPVNADGICEECENLGSCRSCGESVYSDELNSDDVCDSCSDPNYPCEKCGCLLQDWEDIICDSCEADSCELCSQELNSEGLCDDCNG